MEQFEKNLAKEISLEKSPEIFFEYSPETIDFLKRTRGMLVHYLGDFENEIPNEIISGKTEYKCQRNWFVRLKLLEVINDKLEKNKTANNEIANLVKSVTALTKKVWSNKRTTEEQIERADEILNLAIKELDAIIVE